MAINRNNYEEYFLLYIDRELGRDEQLMVEDYVRMHPDLEKEFDLLKQTIALPPVTIFEGKEKLVKEEKERRIFPIFWMRIAATLIILLAGGWLLLVITGETKRRAETVTASNQMATHQERSNPDGSKTKVPESSAKPANPASGENPQNRNLAAVTNAANAQKEHLINGTKTRSGKKGNTPIGTNPPNRHYIKSDPADNPEKNSPESSESLSPSIVSPPLLSSLKTIVAADRFGGQRHQKPTELPSTISHQPTTKIDNPDIAQNNKLPEINAANPSTIHHPLSTIPPSTINHQPSTVSADAPENSQSILVFDNNNKTVTGFFKKLLAKSGDEQVTADNRKRKIKISVFQFNVSK